MRKKIIPKGIKTFEAKLTPVVVCAILALLLFCIASTLKAAYIALVMFAAALMVCALKCAPLFTLAFAIKYVFDRLPEPWRKRVIALVARIPLNPRIRALSQKLQAHKNSSLCKEAIRFLKPWAIAMIFLSTAPIAVLMMFCHWVRNLFVPHIKAVAIGDPNDDTLRIVQNKHTQWNSANQSFYWSPAFPLTILATFALGLPMAILFGLNHFLSVGAFLNQIPMGAILSAPDTQVHLSVIHQSLPAQNGGTNLSQFELYAYLVSISSCISVLFFRAWFTFPYNFLDTEFDIDFNECGIRKQPIKGWLLEIVWYGFPGYAPRFMPWEEVQQVKYELSGYCRFSQFPNNMFAAGSVAHKFLERHGAYGDALLDKFGRTEYIVFSSRYDSLGSGIRVHLADLDQQDKARLFYAIRKWLPSLYIDPQVQEKLIGSTIMKEPKYTEIWFDLLMSKGERQRQDLLEAGDILRNGGYTVIRQLACGGQAVVYLAKTAQGDQVVLKEFVLSTGETAGALIESGRDFENESTVLSRLSHPNVVKMLDIFAEDRRAYVVLEHVAGVTLRKFVNENGPLSEEQVIALALQMCTVLQYLHDQDSPVVHRDFTPENIIVRSDLSIKLIDFSVASRTGPHRDGDCVGKHSYTPPEQFRSMTCPQSDIYAFGASIYFLLTGIDPKPISKSNPQEERPELSEEIASIVEQATELDISKRYENIEWMRIDLNELAEKMRPAPTSLLPTTECTQTEEDVDTSISIVLPRRSKILNAS